MRHVLKPKQEAAKVIRRMFWTTSMGSLNLPTQHIVICGFPSLKMTRPHQDHQVGFLPQKIGFSFKDPWFPVGTMAGGCFFGKNSTHSWDPPAANEGHGN